MLKRSIAVTLGASAGALLASMLSPHDALADTGSAADAAAAAVFPEAPGPDAFTLGSYTFDPYLNLSGTGIIDPVTEGFNPLSQGTGTPGFFETGSSSLQGFEVFSPANGSTAATELGTIQTTENVSSLGSITNTGFDITGESPAAGGSLTDLPTIGTVYDVTNFGGGLENIYTDVPGAAGAAGTATDTLVTSFGDVNLSDLVSTFDLSALDPASAFGLGADAASATADAAGSFDPLALLGL